MLKFRLPRGLPRASPSQLTGTSESRRRRVGDSRAAAAHRAIFSNIECAGLHRRGPGLATCRSRIARRAAVAIDWKGPLTCVLRCGETTGPGIVLSRVAIDGTVAARPRVPVTIVVVALARIGGGEAGGLRGLRVGVGVTAVPVVARVPAVRTRGRRTARSRTRVRRRAARLSEAVLVAVWVPREARLARLAGRTWGELIRAHARLRDARAGQVAQVGRGADDRVRPHARAVVAEIGLRAGITIVAGRRVAWVRAASSRRPSALRLADAPAGALHSNAMRLTRAYRRARSLIASHVARLALSVANLVAAVAVDAVSARALRPQGAHRAVAHGAARTIHARLGHAIRVRRACRRARVAVIHHALERRARRGRRGLAMSVSVARRAADLCRNRPRRRNGLWRIGSRSRSSRPSPTARRRLLRRSGVFPRRS